MTSIVEENGSSTIDNLAPPETVPGGGSSTNNNNNHSPSPHPHLPPPLPQHQGHHSPVPSSAVLAPANIVQIIPSQQTSSHQTHSVIQPNQQSVIQTATGTLQPMTLPKSVLLVSSKPNSVIHTTTQGGTLQTVQIKQEQNMGSNMMNDTNSEDSFTDEESPKKRRDLLVRRPSYRKILNDLGGGEIGGGTLVQYTQGQDGQPIFVPVNIGNNVMAEDQSRKREMRLMKNREAARECRRKKKEYIKCLENRVAVLENQNKALIDELKSLKELYCQTKSEWESVVVVPKQRGRKSQQHQNQPSTSSTTTSSNSNNSNNNFDPNATTQIMIVPNHSTTTDEEHDGDDDSSQLSQTQADALTLTQNNNNNILNTLNSNQISSNKEQKIVFVLV